MDDDLLCERICGRYNCVTDVVCVSHKHDFYYRLCHIPSGRTYHKKFNPPNVSMKDDVSCLVEKLSL